MMMVRMERCLISEQPFRYGYVSFSNNTPCSCILWWIRFIGLGGLGCTYTEFGGLGIGACG
jgi:hypothetical protein